MTLPPPRLPLTRHAYDTSYPHLVPADDNSSSLLVAWKGTSAIWQARDWQRWQTAATHLWATSTPTDQEADVLVLVPSTMLLSATWAALKLHNHRRPGLRVNADSWEMVLSCFRSTHIDPHDCWWWIDDRHAHPDDLARHGYPGPHGGDPHASAVCYRTMTGQYAKSLFADTIDHVLDPPLTYPWEPSRIDPDPDPDPLRGFLPLGPDTHAPVWPDQEHDHQTRHDVVTEQTGD